MIYVYCTINIMLLSSSSTCQPSILHLYQWYVSIFPGEFPLRLTRLVAPFQSSDLKMTVEKWPVVQAFGYDECLGIGKVGDGMTEMKI